VVVTIQYRLGSLGFLSTGSKTLPGNAALWDMVLAVQWTRNYIGFFGGNPHKIVVMGHGTGASSAIMVALSNVAKGLASGIVAMSGSSLSRFATDDAPKNTAMQVAEANGCPVVSELTMVKCLQNLSPDSIIKVKCINRIFV
jgi:carboxylesterase type B